MTHRTRPLHLLAPLALTAALALAPRAASAQVEARCPPGFTSVPARGEGMIAACVNPPMQIVATMVDRAITPSGPDERQLAEQLAAQAGGAGGAVTATAFRTETVAGITARVADLSGNGTSETGAPARIEGTVMIFPVGSGSVVVMGMSRDAAHGNVRNAVRAFVPTMAGLAGPAPAWRASASCPPGMPESPEEGPGPGGTRRVVSCGTPGAGQFDVLESRLPVRNAQDARGPAENLQRQLQGMLARLGGSATLDATQPVTYGAVHGFATAVHGSASPPGAPPGEAPALRLEGIVVVIPTPVGYVQVISLSRQSDANAVAEQVRGFVTNQLRLDGAQVRPAAAGDGGAVTGDGGAAGETAATAPPPRREHRIDPNAPLWQPPDEDRPAAHHEEEKKKGACGCAVPGGARGGAESALGLGALAFALALGLRARARRGR